MAIGFIGSLSDINQSARLGQEATQYLGKSLISLGDQISNTLSMKAAQKEAEQIAPFLQRSYFEAYEDIAKGNSALGISKAIGLASQYGANPILGRVTKEATQLAGQLAGEYEAMERTQFATNGRTDMLARRTQIAQDKEAAQQLAGLEERVNNLKQSRQTAAAQGIDTSQIDPMLVQAESQLADFRQSQPLQSSPVQFGPGRDTPFSGEPIEGEMPVDSGLPEVGQSGLFPPSSEPMSSAADEALFQSTPDPSLPQVSPQPQAAPQQAAPQQAVPASEGQPMFGKQAQEATGVQISITEKGGVAVPLSGASLNANGQMSLSFSAGEKKKTITLDKASSEAYGNINKNTPLMAIPIRDFLSSNGGIANAEPEITEVSDASTPDAQKQYIMSMMVNVPVEDAEDEDSLDDGAAKVIKTKRVKVDYVKRDENGIPAPILLSSSDKKLIDGMESDYATVTTALRNIDQNILIDDTAASKDARRNAEAEVKSTPFPFKGDVDSFITAAGGDASKATDDQKMDINRMAIDTIDSMAEKNAFTDSEGKALTPQDSEKLFKQELTKLVTTKGGSLDEVFSKAVREETPALTLSDVGVSDDVAKKIEDYEGPLDKALGMASFAAAGIGKLFTDIKKDAGINTKYIPIFSQLIGAKRMGVITKDEFDSEVTAIRGRMNEEKKGN